MLSPRTLSGLYDLHLAAVWRGHAPPSMFSDWLEARWWADGPAEPAAPPDAVSVLGGAGGGIRWYGRGDSIVGYVTGRPRGCYVVALNDIPPQPPTAFPDWSPTRTLFTETVQ
jgi:hypothetical protein